MGEPVKFLRTVSPKTFLSDGTNGHNCGEIRLEAGTLCEVLSSSKRVYYVQPIEEGLTHYWAAVGAEYMEPLNEMEVLALVSGE